MSLAAAVGDQTSLSGDNSSGVVFIRVAIPELKVQKCLQFQLEQTVWQAKLRVLATFAKDLRDALNFGLYLPPANGRAGKFMEEERQLSEYPIQGPIGFLEFKYKRRVYKMMQINERKLKQIHVKSKLKTFQELVRTGNTEKINKLTLKGLDPNFHDHDNGETPLTLAMALGRNKCREVIIGLVSGGAHLDFRNRQGQTPLHRAAIVGNAEAIRTLLDLGASPNCKDARNLTPLYYSVSNDDSFQDCTLMLLHERCHVGMCDEQGWYEVHQACKNGRVQHLEHLVFYGADMDVRNSCGNTALHICALHNQEACARLLLFRGADATLGNHNNQTAGQAAMVAGNLPLAALINSHKPEDVVPYREIPQYSQRRKGITLTPSLRAMLRSRSDPRINVSGLDSQPTSTASSPYGLTGRRPHPGHDSDSNCSISVASTGSVIGVTDQGMYEGRTISGREGYFPAGHLSEVNIRRAGSMGDVNNITRGDNQQHTVTPLLQAKRESQPRIVLLQRSSEGYGFVLRGAKSKLPRGAGFSDFTPTLQYPALQYLDSVDPGSQADRAGLRAGDFILEINGESVVKSSHEHVVHLIRSSSDVLTLKVVTVAPTEPAPGDWSGYQESGAMTLPNRKRIVAPQPPQRDPHTSLSYSRASSKSLAEGLAEVEKLDAAIAEFEGQEVSAAHSRSFDQHHAADDQKVASVRASHAVKRVSVMDYEGLMTGDPGTPGANENKMTKSPRSPAEMRINQYHKTSPSQAMERSKSTPDVSAAVDNDVSEINHRGHMTGSWVKNRGPVPPVQNVNYMVNNSSPGPRTGPYAGKPATPDTVRIHSTVKNTPLSESDSSRLGSHYESSFRPVYASGSSAVSHQSGDKFKSFADDLVLDNADNFNHSNQNATLLVKADIHSDIPGENEDKVLYEPEPDYDEGDDYRGGYPTPGRSRNSPGVSGGFRTNVPDDLRSVVKQNMAAITVISIGGSANREHSKPASSLSSPRSQHLHENMPLTSPQSSSGSRRSPGGAMTASQPSSSESSRRSSIQSNISGDNTDSNGRSYTTSANTPGSSRNFHETEFPPPPPPPPPPVMIGNSSVGEANFGPVTKRLQNREAISVLPSRVSADDILAAVAERQSRLESDGPRVSEVKPLPASKSTLELNQEALKAAVAKRKSRIEELGQDQTIVNEIEARLNRNKKLQAAKFLRGEGNRNAGGVKTNEVSPVTKPVEPASVQLSTDENDGGPVRAQEQAPLALPLTQSKEQTPRVPVNSSVTGKQTLNTGVSDPVKNSALPEVRSGLKPVDVKATGSLVAIKSKEVSSTAAVTTSPPMSGANVTTIVMSKTTPGKTTAPPPPPPPAMNMAAVPTQVFHHKPGQPTLVTNKTGLQTKPTSTSPISTTGPSTNDKPATADYIALAERARQEYLKKKASGNLQASIGKKGPVEITPTRKTSQRASVPTSSIFPTSSSKEASPSDAKPLTSKGENGDVSVQNRIKLMETNKNSANGKANVAGVTEDHSHTEISLNNGTLKKPPSNNPALPSANTVLPGFDPKITAPPSRFSDGNGIQARGVVIDIISPPSSFSTAGSPDSAFSTRSFGPDDTVSNVSSVSSLSTLSSERGDGIYSNKTKDIKDFIVHSPPPPPDFSDSSLGDQFTYIPPPREFLEIDANANESTTVDNNSKPFASKAVSDWSCKDVLDWLDSLNMPQYRIQFAKANIDGARLVNMNKNDLANLGVSQANHRMSLERSMKKLNLSASTDL